MSRSVGAEREQLVWNLKAERAPAEISFRLFRNVQHHRFWQQQLAVAWDQHLIADLDGLSFAALR
jgi:hypothetical protein